MGLMGPGVIDGGSVSKSDDSSANDSACQFETFERNVKSHWHAIGIKWIVLGKVSLYEYQISKIHILKLINFQFIF